MKPSLKFRSAFFLWFTLSSVSSIFIPPVYAQTEQGALESPAPQVTAPASGASVPQNDGPSGVPSLTVIKPAPARDVGRLMQDLVAEISKKSKTLKAQETVSTPRTIASTPTVFESVPKIAKPKKLKKQTIKLEPGYNLSKPVLDPNQIQSIARNMPEGGSERKEIVEKIATVAEGVKQGREGSDEDAVRLIQKLREYTFDPYVISGKRLAAQKNRLSMVPANVSLITKRDLTLQGSKTVQEAMSLLEGVVMYDQIGNGYEQTIGLRGFETGTEVATIVDGIRYNEPDGGVVNYSLLNVDDVEQIEIARGSYSGVYGNSAFGGVVNITTRQASEEKFHPFGTFEYGTNQRFYFSGGASGTIPDEVTGMDGKVKYVFSASRKMTDNFRSNSEIRLTNFLNKWGYVWADDAASIHFKLNYADNAMSNPGELTVAQYHRAPEISTKPLDGRKFEDLVLQADSHIKLHEKVNLKFNAYRRVEDIDFTTTIITFGPLFSTNVTQLLTTKSFASSVSYDETVGFLHNTFEVGVEQRNEEEDDRGKPVDSAGNVGNILGDQSVSLDTTGLFMQNTTELFERLSATVGLRYDHVDYTFNDTAITNVRPDWAYNNTSTQAGAVLKLVEHAETYVNYSEGFKTPGISELFSIAFFGFGNPDLVPEKARSYELGLRTRKMGDFSGNVSVFHIDLQNEILFDPIVFMNRNVGKSRRNGIEFSTKYQPVDAVEAFFTYTYTKANLRSSLPGTSAYQSGDDIGLVPRNRFTAGFNITPFEWLRLHIDGIYTGEQHSQAFEALSAEARAIDSMIKGYFVANGRLSVIWKETEFFLQMANILDNHYVSRSVTAGFPIPQTYVTPGQGREISCGTRFQFG